MEVVAFGIVFIRIEIAENVGDVNEIFAAVRSAAIVQTRTGASEIFEKVEYAQLIVSRPFVIRSAVDAVKLLYP
jgi:hypothetical protein